MHWAEFIALPDDDRRELVAGELLELEVSDRDHAQIIALLGAFLTQWRLSGGNGLVLGSGYKVRIDDDTGLMPDVQYFRRGRVIPEYGLEEGGPDLAIEVISPSSGRFDRGIKLESYGAIGTAEYWIVDPKQQTLHRYLLRDGALKLEEILQGDVNFHPGTFSGLQIPLAQLWTLPS
jgi:Uma2 family endonuclease